jgi:hypothetical protein
MAYSKVGSAKGLHVLAPAGKVLFIKKFCVEFPS